MAQPFENTQLTPSFFIQSLESGNIQIISSGFYHLLDIPKIGSGKFKLLREDQQKGVKDPSERYKKGTPTIAGLGIPGANLDDDDIKQFGTGRVADMTVKIVQSDDQLIERLGFIISAMKIGNTSTILKNELTEIVDILKSKKILTAREHKAITMKYVLR